MTRILVADDSPTVLQIAEAILSDAGYQVATCATGAAAVKLMRHEVFDLLLTDIYMPDKDGLELIQQVRRRRSPMPVVAMSAMTGTRDMLAVARVLGAWETLRKPFSKPQLLSVVEAALEAGVRHATPAIATPADGAW